MFRFDATHVQCPPAYTKSATNFWTEPHCSERLLEAHLDPDFEGASRKHAFMERSVAFIKERIPPAIFPQLIDFGCGPGLYAERLAACGFVVTGVDFSERSIAYAKASAARKGLDIRYIFQDYLSFAPEKSYDAATIIYCDYGALSDQSRRDFLRTVYNSLRPGGVFLLDVCSAAYYEAFSETRTWQHWQDGGFWRKEPYATLDIQKKYVEEQIAFRQTVVMTADNTSVYYFWDTCFTKERLQREVESAGFELLDFYADVAGAPFHPESRTVAALFQKP